jgi:hypothetical protein
MRNNESINNEIGYKINNNVIDYSMSCVQVSDMSLPVSTSKSRHEFRYLSTNNNTVIAYFPFDSTQ